MKRYNWIEIQCEIQGTEFVFDKKWICFDDVEKARQQLKEFAKEYGLGCDDWLNKIDEVLK